MCRSMVDIHSATGEIRQGKKEEEERRKKKEITGQNIMSASATQGGHKKSASKQNLTVPIEINVKKTLKFNK